MTDTQEQAPPPAPDASTALPPAPPPSSADLIVSLEGFDGPIDLLLSLAKEQKVDLSTLSILALAEQYLAYIASARKLRLEIAADYLVMAAWLAYLKSRLLLPDQPEEEPNSAALAEALKFQLIRLEAMQKAAADLLALPQLGSDFFARGCGEALEVCEKPVYYLPLFDLLSALGAPLRRRKKESYTLAPTKRLYSLEESLRRMRRLLGALPDWRTLATFMPDLGGHDPLEIKGALASTFSAALEMVKAGELELKQAQTFAPIYLKSRSQDATDQNQ